MEKFIVKIAPIMVNGTPLAAGAALESTAEFDSALSAEMFLDDFDRNWKENSVGDASPTVGLRRGCLVSAVLTRGTTVYSASITTKNG